MLSGITTLVSAEQSENAFSPIVSTLSGISIFFIPEQLENADFSILTTPFGIITLSRFVQEKNASSGIVVRFADRVISLRLVQ